MENPIKNGWFGGTIIFGNTHMWSFPGGATFTLHKKHPGGVHEL